MLEEPKPEEKEMDKEAKHKAELRDIVNKMNRLKLMNQEKDKHLREAQEIIKSMKVGPTFAQATAADEVFSDPSKQPSSPDAKFKANASDKADTNEDMSGEPSQKQSPRFESTFTEKPHGGKCKKQRGKAAKGEKKIPEEDADITNESSSAEKNSNSNANPDLDASFFGPQKEDISAL